MLNYSQHNLTLPNLLLSTNWTCLRLPACLQRSVPYPLSADGQLGLCKIQKTAMQKKYLMYREKISFKGKLKRPTTSNWKDSLHRGGGQSHHLSATYNTVLRSPLRKFNSCSQFDPM